jgi:hypothetical protein
MLCGRLQEVIVRVRDIPVTEQLQGDYFNNEAYRAWFQEWLNRLWLEKDARIAAILTKARTQDRKTADTFQEAA